MPEQKLTYQQRVNGCAKSYADSYNSMIDIFEPQETIRHFQYEGKKSVAAQAEAIREYEKSHFYAHTTDVEKYLLENGYIEPKTEDEQ